MESYIYKILDSELICFKPDYPNYISGRDTSATRGGHNRENDSYDKNSGTGRRGGYQGKNSRSDNDREGDRKGGGRRGGFKSSNKPGNRDLNYEGGKASTSEDQTYEANSLVIIATEKATMPSSKTSSASLIVFV